MTAQKDPAVAVGLRRSWQGLVGRFARANGLQIGILSVLLLIWGVFRATAPLTFSAWEIYGALMATIPFYAVMALPLTMVVVAGEMDLSFGSIMGLGMLVFVNALEASGSVTLAFLLCLLAGVLAGLANGLIVVRLGIPSLVATLGMQFFWRGVVDVVTQGKPASLVPVKGTILHDALVGRIGGRVPAQMIWTVAVAIVVWILLNRHRFGAHIYLVGDNRESARLMGVNVNRTRMMAFAVVGLAAAFAGLLSSLEVSYFWVTLGEGYLLRTLASVFIGGTSVFGGRGTIFGTFIGCLIIGTIEPGLVASGLTGFWTKLVYGLIIVGSVVIHAVLSRRLAR